MATPEGNVVGLLRVFAHVTADKCVLYRAILRVFVEAKAGFALHLRPLDVRDALRELDPAVHAHLDEVESALTQLCGWNNLEAHRDPEVATVEEFYRSRHLYQLTGTGEAAERALATFHEALVQPGELQSHALEDIQTYLGELEILAGTQPPDPGKVFQVLDRLRGRYESLTSRAQTFMRSLQRRIDLQGIEMEAFLAYKERLIEYLERFVEGLIVATGEIGQRIERIEARGLPPLLEMAARRELVDALLPSAADHEEALRLWQRRWTGFRHWFISRPGHPSQAEVLRGRARGAIPILLAAVTGINERRQNRSDRVADLRTLARWFAGADSDADAHRLWRAAFCLGPARHWQVDEATLLAREQAPISAQMSWFDAPPVVLSPRLHKTGRQSTRNAARPVVDRRAEKAILARLAQDEAAQIVAAQARLATGRRMRLSEVGELDPSAFDLFLDLLGEVLVGYVEHGRPAEAESSNGALRIRLEPPDDERAQATVVTPRGTFRGRDYFVTVGTGFPEHVLAP